MSEINSMKQRDRTVEIVSDSIDGHILSFPELPLGYSQNYAIKPLELVFMSVSLYFLLECCVCLARVLL